MFDVRVAMVALLETSTEGHLAFGPGGYGVQAKLVYEDAQQRQQSVTVTSRSLSNVLQQLDDALAGVQGPSPATRLTRSCRLTRQRARQAAQPPGSLRPR
jgi:hypothetical protein